MTARVEAAPSAQSRVPEFFNGHRLTRREFERRYSAAFVNSVDCETLTRV